MQSERLRVLYRKILQAGWGESIYHMKADALRLIICFSYEEQDELVNPLISARIRSVSDEERMQPFDSGISGIVDAQGWYVLSSRVASYL